MNSVQNNGFPLHSKGKWTFRKQTATYQGRDLEPKNRELDLGRIKTNSSQATALARVKRAKSG